jgi:hypothetical protein
LVSIPDLNLFSHNQVFSITQLEQIWVPGTTHCFWDYNDISQTLSLYRFADPVCRRNKSGVTLQINKVMHLKHKINERHYSENARPNLFQIESKAFVFWKEYVFAFPSGTCLQKLAQVLTVSPKGLFIREKTHKEWEIGQIQLSSNSMVPFSLRRIDTFCPEHILLDAHEVSSKAKAVRERSDSPDPRNINVSRRKITKEKSFTHQNVHFPDGFRWLCLGTAISTHPFAVVRVSLRSRTQQAKLFLGSGITSIAATDQCLILCRKGSLFCLDESNFRGARWVYQ